MRAVLYLRKSRADDAREAVEDTLRRHEDTLRGLAAEQGFALCGVYREVASGDTLAGRKEMQRLLAACETGEFQAVLCMDIDRLGRGSMAEQGYILDTFKRAGVRLVTPRKTFDLNDDIDETYSEFESFIARQELKAIKRRLQRGIRRAAEEGSFLSVPPYGYRRDTVEGHPSLRIEPAEAEAVVLAFRLYTEEGLGCPQIAERLGAMGYLPRRAAAFSRSAVGAMLQNPVYAGRVVRQGAGGVTDTEGLHPPLISPALFEAAARLRQARGRLPTSPRRLQNPLAGLVICGCCGGKLQRLPPSPTRRQETLACPRRGCNRAVRLSLVEEAVREVLLHHLPATVTPAASPPSPPVTHREQQLAQQEERLFQLVEQGVYTPAEFARRRQALAAQRAALAAPPPPSVPPHVSTAAAYDSADPADRNRLLKLVFSRIVYHKDPDSPPDEFMLDLYLRE